MHQVNSELVEELSAARRDITALEKEKKELLINNRILTRERDDARGDTSSRERQCKRCVG